MNEQQRERGLEVRRADPSDAPTIAEIHVETWLGTYRGYLPDQTLDTLSVKARETMWRRILDGHRPEVFVAADSNRSIGFCNFGPSRDDDLDPKCDGEIYAIYVRPTAWRSGAGSALLAHALDELAELGFQRASLWVLQSNDRARNFYARHRFRAERTAKYPLDGVELDKIRYVRNIAEERLEGQP